MKLKIPKYFLSLCVVCLYLVLGFLVLLKYSVGQGEPDIRFSLFGVVVIAYGIFRGYRAYKEYQIQKEDQDEME